MRDGNTAQHPEETKDSETLEKGTEGMWEGGKPGEMSLLNVAHSLP